MGYYFIKAIIEGDPIAKKQLRCSCIHGKAKLYQPSSKDQARISEIFKTYMGFNKPYACPVKQTVRVYVKIPKSVSKGDRLAMQKSIILPDKKPDLDNYVYMISNAGTGILYDDDKRICQTEHYKFYEDFLGPRTEVIIRPI